MPLPIEPTPSGGCRIHLHIAPRASQSRVVGLHNNCLKLQIAAPPVDGQANQEVIRLLAKSLHVERSRISWVSGESSKRKCIEVSDLTPDQAWIALGVSP